jgi:4-amino-4-deoxy-L-arabinose transferase-like glycosyltransferase
MDTLTIFFAVLTLCLVGVTVHAKRLGNEKRDVAFLGVFSGLLALGTAVSAIFST